MRGPEGPRGSARGARQVATLVAAWPLPVRSFETTTTDAELQHDEGHPVTDVAEGLCRIVIGEERAAARLALSAPPLSFCLSQNEELRAGNANAHRLLVSRHNDLLGRSWGVGDTDP